MIAVKEENDRSQIDALAEDWPVLILDPVDHATTLESVRLIGRAVGESEKADAIADEIRSALARLGQADGQRALYLIWRKPLMAAGSDTFIHAMLESVGLVNAAAGLDGRYPEIDDAALAQAAPDVILAASEPYPFQEKHRAELQSHFSKCAVYFVDGQAFSWHGVRTLRVGNALNRLVRNIVAGA